MMATKERNFSPLKDLSLEELVPEDNFYRRLERTVDLSFVRELVSDRYALGGRSPQRRPGGLLQAPTRTLFRGFALRAPADGEDRCRAPRHPLVLGLRSFRTFARPLQPNLHPPALRARGFQALLRGDRPAVYQGGVGVGQGAVVRLYQGRQANACVDSLLPGFAVEAHLERLFEDEEVRDAQEGGTLRSSLSAALRALPTADDQELRTKNAAKSD